MMNKAATRIAGPLLCLAVAAGASFLSTTAQATPVATIDSCHVGTMMFNHCATLDPSNIDDLRDLRGPDAPEEGYAEDAS